MVRRTSKLKIATAIATILGAAFGGVALIANHNAPQPSALAERTQRGAIPIKQVVQGDANAVIGDVTGNVTVRISH